MSHKNCKKQKRNNGKSSDSKKSLVCYLHKRDPDTRMKEYKIKIEEDEHKKTTFPCVCNTTPKEDVLELVTLFCRHVKDCKMFVARLDSKMEAQKAVRLKAKKKVHRLFKGYLFDNAVHRKETQHGELQRYCTCFSE